MLLSLVIPCFNEEESLPGLFQSLDTVVPNLVGRGHEVEVIVIDDGSRDRSADLLKEGTTSRIWLRVIRLSRNFGQTAAMSAGFHAARGDILIPFDADLQNDPADIPLLLDKMTEGYDVVSGWRKHRKDKTATRVLPSMAANWLISWVSGVKLHDYGCTLKAYRREVMQDVHLYGEMHRFIPIHAAWNGARVAEIAVSHHPRRLGVSKYGLGRAPNVFLDLMLLRFMWRYGDKPIHIFGKFGLASLGMSMATFVLMVYFKYWGDKPFVETPLPMLTVMFFLFGGLSFLMGFLAEIIMRTYHEAGGRPTYVIREEYLSGTARAPVPRLKSAK